jgi:MYXO-CTERM domain-containing protein
MRETSLMDPDLGGSVAALAALALAVLGSRRRSRAPDSARPTAGERLAGVGTNVSTKVVGAGVSVGRVGTEVAAGALEVGGVAAAATLRTVSRLADTISAAGLSVAAGLVARGAGLMLDGAAAVGDGVRAPLARRRQG